jgi:hypothetical protein
VWHGQPSAQCRAHLALACFDGAENAAEGSLVGIADGQTDEFAQKFGFGVAAERNAYALR